MTTRTDVTVDWSLSPRVITVADPSVSMTMQDLVDTLREIEDTVRGISELKLLDASGKQDLGGGVTVGITVALQNALLAFELRGGPSYIQCIADGGNLVAVDDMDAAISPISPTAFTQVVISQSSSATGIITGSGVTPGDVTDIKNAIFDEIMEDSESFAEQIRLMRAEAAGKTAVTGGTNVKFRDAADSKDRIDATVDDTGQRTAVTTDGS